MAYGSPRKDLRTPFLTLKFLGFCDLFIVEEIAAPEMLLKYSLHEPRRGHADIRPGRVPIADEGFPNPP